MNIQINVQSKAFIVDTDKRGNRIPPYELKKVTERTPQNVQDALKIFTQLALNSRVGNTPSASTLARLGEREKETRRELAGKQLAEIADVKKRLETAPNPSEIALPQAGVLTMIAKKAASEEVAIQAVGMLGALGNFSSLLSIAKEKGTASLAAIEEIMNQTENILKRHQYHILSGIGNLVDESGSVIIAHILKCHRDEVKSEAIVGRINAALKEIGA
ncbi:hypothetical protein FJZ26_03870 [Candidatus Parvarchaeota archaeon]|nr:hypothetical protein [Candidatus Parvarchaeota archaeon]